jgi:GH15 family glucan-1,4-alpha-glucosidase
MTSRIGDYGLIGDCRAAALVSRLGSIDWLCWPRFDSPSLFGALLDDEAGGRWSLAPAGSCDARRAYLEDTNVLSTTFTTARGRVVVTDFMPVASEQEKRRMLVPDHEILRIARCEAGEVELEQRFAPRPGYGGERPRLSDRGALGLRLDTRDGTATLRSDMPLRLRDGGARGTVHLRAGDVVYSALGFADDWPAILPPLGLVSERALQRTIDWWRAFAARVAYDGPFAAAVRRSALAIKLLVYAPSGAVVAAPTTSLPERLGGDLNWDYRFCWLRDASLTMRAAMAIGYSDEAQAFASWLLHSTRLTRPCLHILYDVYGNRPSDERVLARWRGFRGSRPVRVGNAAVEQRQLDVYGEVIDATAQMARAGARLDRESQHMLRGFGRYVCRHWREPDEGIWEPRSGRLPHTHSRLLCWVAVDRLLELAERGLLMRAPVDELRVTRDAIRHEIETRAWNEERQSYVAILDGDEVDATLLLLSWYGFADARSPRMRATWRRVERELGARGLLYRYRNAESPGEGAFGICSFWAPEYLALGGGSADEAERALATVLSRANDLGLFAEEIDPETGDALGNFPQAFTHVGLINAAITLARRRCQDATVAPQEVRA